MDEYKERGIKYKGSSTARLGRTRHVDHPAVAVLYNVTCFTLNTAGRHAVHLKEA